MRISLVLTFLSLAVISNAAPHGMHFTRRRFGQEHTPEADKTFQDVKDLAAGSDKEAQAGNLSGAMVRALLAKAPACDQQDRADEVIDLGREFGGEKEDQFIEVAKTYRQLERNTPKDGQPSELCKKAPRNKELEGLTQAQDPTGNPKDNPKDNPIEDPEEDNPKDNPKEDPEEDNPKDNPKEDPEEDKPKDNPKGKPKGKPKDKPKGKPKDNPKEDPEEDNPKDNPKEDPEEDNPKDNPKEDPEEDNPKDNPKEDPEEDNPKDNPKENEPEEDNPPSSGGDNPAESDPVGGVKMPRIQEADDGFIVNGNKFNDIEAAQNRQCDIQHNLCFNKFNAGDRTFSGSDCDEQTNTCKNGSPVIE